MVSTGIVVQRGGRLLLLSADGKRLERLVSQTLLAPIPGLWIATELGDRIFIIDGGVDGSVYLSGGIRVCVVDVASGRQRLIFPDGILKDHLGRPITEIEGASVVGMTDWQLVDLRLLPGEKVLHVTLSHPLSGTAVCAIDSRSGAAVVTENGMWRRSGSALFSDEHAGVLATVEKDAMDTPLVVTMLASNARLVIGVPTGAVGKFSEVAVTQDGKFVAVVLSGAAVYVVDISRRSSRKVATGQYRAPKWSTSGRALMLIKNVRGGEKSALVELNPATLAEHIIVANIDDFCLITRKLPKWKSKSTP